MVELIITTLSHPLMLAILGFHVLLLVGACLWSVWIQDPRIAREEAEAQRRWEMEVYGEVSEQAARVTEKARELAERVEEARRHGWL